MAFRQSNEPVMVGDALLIIPTIMPRKHTRVMISLKLTHLATSTYSTSERLFGSERGHRWLEWLVSPPAF